ncbi:glycosyltransferase family 2 protein [Thalassotalea euphylliae]|uniref:Glycosyltransferase family 2 protein n=1 Tax=Thalassotalea euphylliae TaxID=1655234 RepID=A0A3E0U115_9GAMM|nr:glycosyltransferase family 2 protein [Thalassotalea euphylliae]REL30424.1 glycosyltransferase family 2 protein [Thalassotalea euphylliae]
MYKGFRVAAVIPALNEEQAIGKVVSELVQLTSNNDKGQATAVIDQVVVCDNGSTDATAANAQSAGAHVVRQDQPGYGIACLTALEWLEQQQLKNLQNKKQQAYDIILFVDGDDSCFIEQAERLLAGIASGDDMAIGSRTLGTIEQGALTPPQLFGNWLSSRLIRLFWRQPVTDLGPFRAIRQSALKQLAMADQTFGWTVEMQVKAAMLQLKTSEYPVDSKVRIGQSKISGTVKGTVLAGIGILSMIARLRLFGFSGPELTPTKENTQ